MRIEDMYLGQRVNYKSPGMYFTTTAKVVDLFTRHAQIEILPVYDDGIRTRLLVKIKFLIDATPPLEQLARLAD